MSSPFLTARSMESTEGLAPSCNSFFITSQGRRMGNEQVVTMIRNVVGTSGLRGFGICIEHDGECAVEIAMRM